MRANPGEGTTLAIRQRQRRREYQHEHECAGGDYEPYYQPYYEPDVDLADGEPWNNNYHIERTSRHILQTEQRHQIRNDVSSF